MQLSNHLQMMKHSCNHTLYPLSHTYVYLLWFAYYTTHFDSPPNTLAYVWMHTNWSVRVRLEEDQVADTLFIAQPTFRVPCTLQYSWHIFVQRLQFIVGGQAGVAGEHTTLEVLQQWPRLTSSLSCTELRTLAVPGGQTERRLAYGGCQILQHKITLT